MSLKFQNSEHKNNLEKPLWFYRQGLFVYIQFHTSSSRVFISETLELSFQNFTFEFELESAKKLHSKFGSLKKPPKIGIFNNDLPIGQYFGKLIKRYSTSLVNVLTFVAL